jgi:hypothetical protein
VPERRLQKTRDAYRNELADDIEAFLTVCDNYGLKNAINRMRTLPDGRLSIALPQRYFQQRTGEETL